MLYAVSTLWKKYETPDSAALLLDDLRKHAKHITALDLSSNTYTPAVFKEIAAAIKNMENLRTVKLESFLDTLTFEEMTEVVLLLSDALPRNLVSLELPSNALSCLFPEAFAKFLEESELAVLVLYDCGLGQEGVVRVMNALSKRPKKEKLTKLDLSKNRINKLNGEFGKILNLFENLEEFRIRNNTIEKESMTLFLQSYLGKNLRVLDLSDNFVCGECVVPFCDLLTNIHLRELYLQDTKMYDGEINVILEALCDMCTEELPGGTVGEKPELILDISCIDFEQDTVPILEKLADKMKIKKLVIFENCFEDIKRLKETIEAEDGVVVDEEDDLVAAPTPLKIEEAIVEKLKLL